MLYYLFKFFHLFKQKPLQVFAHFQSLYAEWSDDRRGQLVNEVLYIIPDEFASKQCLPQPVFEEPFERIIWYLSKAKYSIDVAMFTINSPVILKALVAAVGRRVRVRVVTHTKARHITEYSSDIEVRRLSLQKASLMHNKFCIIDGFQSLRELQPKGAKEPVTVCVTGSMNWIKPIESCDDVLITSAPRMCRLLEQEFEQIWNNCPLTKHSTQ